MAFEATKRELGELYTFFASWQTERFHWVHRKPGRMKRSVGLLR